MKRFFVSAVMAALLGLVLAGCQNPGTVGGAVTGALIGSQFGKGQGKTAATIGGALLGGYVGNRAIDEPRQRRYYRQYGYYY